MRLIRLATLWSTINGRSMTRSGHIKVRGSNSKNRPVTIWSEPEKAELKLLIPAIRDKNGHNCYRSFSLLRLHFTFGGKNWTLIDRYMSIGSGEIDTNSIEFTESNELKGSC